MSGGQPEGVEQRAVAAILFTRLYTNSMSDRARIVAEQEVQTLIHMALRGPKRSPGLGLTLLDPLTDPFRETVLAYAYNLLVVGILNGLRVVRSSSEGSLQHRLVKENRVRVPKRRWRRAIPMFIHPLDLPVEERAHMWGLYLLVR